MEGLDTDFDCKGWIRTPVGRDAGWKGWIRTSIGRVGYGLQLEGTPVGRVGFGLRLKGLEGTLESSLIGRDVGSAVDWKGHRTRTLLLEGLDSSSIGRVGSVVNWKGWIRRQLEGLEGTLYPNVVAGRDIVVDCSD